MSEVPAICVSAEYCRPQEVQAPKPHRMQNQNNSGKGPLECRVGVSNKPPQPHSQASGHTQTQQSGSSSNMCLSVSPRLFRRTHSPSRRIEIEVEPMKASSASYLTHASGMLSGSPQLQNAFSNQQKPNQNVNSNPFTGNLRPAVSHENLRPRLISQDSEEIDPFSSSCPISVPNYGRQRNSYSPEYTSDNLLSVPSQSFFSSNNNLSRCRSTEQLKIPSAVSPFAWLGLSPRASPPPSPFHLSSSPKSRSRAPSPLKIGNGTYVPLLPRSKNFTQFLSGLKGGNRSPKLSSLSNNDLFHRSVEELNSPSPVSQIAWLDLPPFTSQHLPSSPKSRSRSSSPTEIGSPKILSWIPKVRSIPKFITDLAGGNHSPKDTSPKFSLDDSFSALELNKS